MSSPLPALILVTRNLPPLRGGMERLNARIVVALAANHSVTVIAPKGSRIDAISSVRLVLCPWSGVMPFLIWATLVTAMRAVRERPRWVLGGSGLVAPVVLIAGWLSGARRAVYLHGLDIVVDSRAYRAIWLPAIRRMHRCVVNSANTCRLAVEADIDVARVKVVFPGVHLPTDTDVAPPDPEAFRAEYRLGSGPIVLSVGRLTQRKGLAEFIEHGMKLLLQDRPDIQLVVIGDDAPDAVNASGKGQGKRIQEAAVRAGVSASIHVLGPVSEDVLRAAFRAASVHVFPGIDVHGDVEGFGMVAIEAAAHGVPTVAFAVGGVPDAVDDPCSGSLVLPGDYRVLAKRLLEWVEGCDAKAGVSCRAFARRFEWHVFDRSMRDALTLESEP